MDLQNVSNINVPQGEVRTIHDKDNRLLWGRVSYDTTYRGDTQQTTYTGKNLLENKLTSTTINNVTATLNSDGSVKLTGTSNSSSNTWFIMHDNTFVLPAGTYTFSGGISNSVALYNDSFGLVTSSTTKTLTGSSSGNWSIRVAPNAATNVTVFPMVESGSTATTFEPYVGGVPSPNPSYPQDIYTVSGEQTVNIYSGKNLLPFTSQNFTLRGITYKCQNGNLYLDGTSQGETGSSSAEFKTNFAFTLPAGTYTVNLQEDITLCYVKKMSDSTNLATVNGRTIKSATFTLTETTELYLGFYVYQKTFTDKQLPIQLEVGSSPTSYEPYMGSSFTVGLTSKNLSVIDGYINIGWGESKSDFLSIVNSLPAGTYNLSMKFTLTARTDTSDASVYGIYFQNSGGNWNDRSGTWGNKTAGDSATFSHSFTISAGAVGNFTACYFYGCGIQGIGQTGATNITEIMLEKGSSSSGYTPYFTPIELCKISKYAKHQDYIYKSGNNWYIHKEVGKAVFDGSEAWDNANINRYRYPFGISVTGKAPSSVGQSQTDEVFCDIFYPSPSSEGDEDYKDWYTCRGTTYGNKCWFFMPTSSLSGSTSAQILAAYKTWLSTHNATFYYILATPTDTQITDATLLSQLNAIHQWLTRYGYQYGVVGTLPIIIDQEDLN